MSEDYDDNVAFSNNPKKPLLEEGGLNRKKKYIIICTVFLSIVIIGIIILIIKNLGNKKDENKKDNDFIVLHLCMSEGLNPMTIGVQGFRLPPTFSLLWTLDPNPSLEWPFLFLLSFLSGHSEIPPATAVFFYNNSKFFPFFIVKGL